MSVKDSIKKSLSGLTVGSVIGGIAGLAAGAALGTLIPGAEEIGEMFDGVKDTAGDTITTMIETSQQLNANDLATLGKTADFVDALANVDSTLNINGQSIPTIAAEHKEVLSSLSDSIRGYIADPQNYTLDASEITALGDLKETIQSINTGDFVKEISPYVNPVADGMRSDLTKLGAIAGAGTAGVIGAGVGAGSARQESWADKIIAERLKQQAAVKAPS